MNVEHKREKLTKKFHLSRLKSVKYFAKVSADNFAASKSEKQKKKKKKKKKKFEKKKNNNKKN